MSTSHVTPAPIDLSTPPRCPKCGQTDLSLGVVEGRIRVLCGTCPRAYFVTVLSDLAQFFGPSGAVAQAVTHLRLALAQALPTDDLIIIGHVRDALTLLEGNPKNESRSGQ